MRTVILSVTTADPSSRVHDISLRVRDGYADMSALSLISLFTRTCSVEFAKQTAMGSEWKHYNYIKAELHFIKCIPLINLTDFISSSSAQIYTPKSS